MRKKQKKKIIFLVSICALLVIGFVIKMYMSSTINVEEKKSEIYTKNYLDKTQPTSNKIEDNKEVIEDTIVNFTKKAIFKVSDDEFTVQVTEHTTVYDAMNSLMSEGKMTFDGQEYTGLGFFVTQINSLEAVDGKNLMYYINGKEASLGVSTYVIKEGDIIEWKLK